MNQFVDEVYEQLRTKDGDQPEFLAAVHEVLESLKPFLEKEPKYSQVLTRIVEPERCILFRVPWVDDEGKPRVNRGFRVQFNSAIGPYKGGLRFHPSVNLSIIKFLGFEQIFKNALCGLPIGGGKGGSDFDPKGKSEQEVMGFCQSFMTELAHHIGKDTDVPAGDVGVGGREIGFLFGQFKRMRHAFQAGVLTGKGLAYGGSLIRPEATGYGSVYFAQQMLESAGQDFQGKTAIVSGSGNVAQFTIEKVTQLGGKAITASDSSGFILDEDGIDAEKLGYLMKLKNEDRVRIHHYVEKYPNAKFFEGEKPWSVPADCAFPSATQHEIHEEDAKLMIKNGVKLVSEGANMPSTNGAIEQYYAANVLYGPAKAANAGGVATSALEMSQNSQRLFWTRDDVDARLRQIMINIYRQCVNAAERIGNPGNLKDGANVGGFVKVADAMIEQGVV